MTSPPSAGRTVSRRMKPNQSSSAIAPSASGTSHAAQLVEEAKQKILDGLAEAQTGEHLAEPSALKDAIHNSVVNFLYERTKRRPMVLPVIMQV